MTVYPIAASGVSGDPGQWRCRAERAAGALFDPSAASNSTKYCQCERTVAPPSRRPTRYDSTLPLPVFRSLFLLYFNLASSRSLSLLF